MHALLHVIVQMSSFLDKNRSGGLLCEEVDKIVFVPFPVLPYISSCEWDAQQCLSRGEEQRQTTGYPFSLA